MDSALQSFRRAGQLTSWSSRAVRVQQLGVESKKRKAPEAFAEFSLEDLQAEIARRAIEVSAGSGVVGRGSHEAGNITVNGSNNVIQNYFGPVTVISGSGGATLSTPSRFKQPSLFQMGALAPTTTPDITTLKPHSCPNRGCTKRFENVQGLGSHMKHCTMCSSMVVANVKHAVKPINLAWSDKSHPRLLIECEDGVPSSASAPQPPSSTAPCLSATPVVQESPGMTHRLDVPVPKLGFVRASYSIRSKVAFIEFYDKMMKQNSYTTLKDVMAKVGFHDYDKYKSTVSLWLNGSREKILKAWEDPRQRKMKKPLSGRLPSLTVEGERDLCLKLDCQRAMSRQITGRYICVQATYIARDLNINFTATRSWLTKFAKRQNFRHYQCTSTKRTDYGLDPEMRTKFENFVLGLIAQKSKDGGSDRDQKLGKYDLSQLGNVDESPWSFVHQKNLSTWARRGGKQVCVHVPGGASVLKRFCTIIGCIVPDPDTAQPKLYVIFKGTGKGISESEKEDMRRAAGPSIVFGWQENAWTNATIMKDWYETIWKPYVESHELGKEYLLLHDNLKAHKDEVYLASLAESNTIAWFLPPNMTESAQPLDQGFFAVLKLFYSRVMETWLQNPGHLDKWEGAKPFSSCERRLLILEWISQAVSEMQAEQLKDPKKYCYNYFLKCGCLVTLNGDDDNLIDPQSFPNFRVPRERLNGAVIVEPPTGLLPGDECFDDDDAVSDTESLFEEPEDLKEREAFRKERLTDVNECFESLPEVLSQDKKKAKWVRMSKEEVLSSELPARKKRNAIPAIDEQGRLTEWFTGHRIFRLHNEEGWVHAILEKNYLDGLKRGVDKGCNFAASFQSGQFEGEQPRFILLSMDNYDDTGNLTLDAGAWCVVIPQFTENAILDEVVDLDVDDSAAAQSD